MLFKCCTQYVSKFGKLSSGHWTGKGQFSPIPKKGNAKECANYHTIMFISHVSKVMLKILQVSFNSMWTENFQMCKLGFKKAEKSEIKLPTSIGSSKNQGNSRKKYLLLLHWLCWRLSVDHKKLWKILKEMGIPDHLTCLLRNLYADQEGTVRTRHEITGSKLEKECVKVVYCHPAYLTYMQSTTWETLG